ncbi:hypothetical protein KSS87_013174 [Heliosperma pusillum]|nr:hypothetical protein KSS87_013174 [Heliosperma pusillum]
MTTVTVTIFLLIVTLSILPPSESYNHQPLILPLSLSSPKISDVSKLNLRRHLHSASSNARMRLFDDLLANGFAYLLSISVTIICLPLIKIRLTENMI